MDHSIHPGGVIALELVLLGGLACAVVSLIAEWTLLSMVSPWLLTPPAAICLSGILSLILRQGG